MRSINRNPIGFHHAAFAFIVMTLAGCTPLVPGAVATSTLDPSLFDLSLLTGVPCVAPCWYGLEPGRSTKEEVLAAAQTLPFIDPRETQEEPRHYQDPPRQIDKTGTFLRLKCRRPEGGTCAGLLLFDGILKEIYLSPPPSLTFREAVAHLGPPDFVRRYPVPISPAMCNLAMIWKKRAVWVAFLNGPPKKDQVRCADVERGGGVDPDLPVEQVIYSTTDDLAIASAPAPGGDFPWPGFAKP